MPRSRISEADKRRLVDTHDNGENYMVNYVAHTLRIKRGIAWFIIRRYQDQEPIKFRHRGGAKNIKIDEEIVLK